VPLEAEGYIPRIKFSSDPNKLLILTQNRHQDNLKVWVANPRSAECRCIVTDEVKPYVADNAYTHFTTIQDGFILLSERSGYAHLYQYNLLGTQKREIGKATDIITDFYGYDEKTGTYYYQAKDGGPLRTGVYKCDAKGKVTPISTEAGQNSAIFSKNFKHLMLTHHSATIPPTYTLRDAKGKVTKTLQDNAPLKQKIDGMNLASIEFFNFQTQDGVDLNGIMVKPANFDASKKYPVILFQYSGPGSQQVQDSWYAGNCSAALLERYLAQEGFVSVIVDGRGTGGRGAEFEKQTYLKLGQLESHDQVETAIYLSKQPWVDAKHIGIWGWSFGGFNTLMSMSEGRPVFYAGVAVAPPTSWRYYDTVYTERFMRTPKENPEGYDCSPISRAKNLSGSLLIIHGSADDNVHYRNVAEYTEALVHADKDFRQLTYTNRNHSIYGGNTRNHLYRQLVNHFKQSIK
jgi:dipeptidyl-peptidase-4